MIFKMSKLRPNHMDDFVFTVGKDFMLLSNVGKCIFKTYTGQETDLIRAFTCGQSCIGGRLLLENHTSFGDDFVLNTTQV